MSARLFMVLVVVAAHGLVLWWFWRARAPVIDEVETFTSLMIFVTAPQHAAPGAGVDWSAQLPGAAQAELDNE